jgi:hypothetical protein
MTKSLFKQTLLISFLGHITLFSLFSFSFGPQIPKLNNAFVSFQGAILRTPDLMPTPNLSVGHKAGAVARKPEVLILDKVNRESPLVFKDYLKPQITFTLNRDKIALVKELTPKLLIPKRKEPTIMFYPRLPYHFALYFKDRQVAHIELEFQVISSHNRNSIVLKRKISSGNLEADLLSMRYIDRYLFIQQMGFIPSNWQTVKIDLSTLND